MAPRDRARNVRRIRASGTGRRRPHHPGRRQRVVADGVGQQQAQASGRMSHRERLDDASTEVVAHQHHPIQPLCVEPAEQVPGLRAHRNVPSAAFGDGAPVTDHFPGQQTPPGHPRHDLAPKPRRGRNAVHEHQRRSASELVPAHAQVVDVGVATLQAVPVGRPSAGHSLVRRVSGILQRASPRAQAMRHGVQLRVPTVSGLPIPGERRRDNPAERCPAHFTSAAYPVDGTAPGSTPWMLTPGAMYMAWNTANGTGLPKKYPCISSHPSTRSSHDCSCVSTPSATTR